MTDAGHHPGVANDTHNRRRERHHHGRRVGWGHAVMGLVRGHRHDWGDAIDTALESTRRGTRAVKVSFLALVVTSVLQLMLMVVTGSVSLLADTIHNFSDASTVVPLLIAFHLGSRSPTRRYTHGFGRAEDLAGLFVLVVMIVSALLAAWVAIDRLIHPHPVDHLALLVAAGLVGFIGNELVAAYRIREGNAIGSAALAADGYHARTDGFTSLAVAVGAVGVWAGFDTADPIAGLGISIAILVVLRSAAGQVYRRLMDAVDPAIVDLIETRATAIEGVRHVEPPKVRWVGHRLDTTLLVSVDSDLTVADGHSIAEQVRHDLIHHIRHLETVTIHIDPEADNGEDPHAQHVRVPAATSSRVTCGLTRREVVM
jgi:cation diffusion facilitator family transporter